MDGQGASKKQDSSNLKNLTVSCHHTTIAWWTSDLSLTRAQTRGCAQERVYDVRSVSGVSGGTFKSLSEVESCNNAVEYPYHVFTLKQPKTSYEDIIRSILPPDCSGLLVSWPTEYWLVGDMKSCQELSSRTGASTAYETELLYCLRSSNYPCIRYCCVGLLLLATGNWQILSCNQRRIASKTLWKEPSELC
jgi:hypothetical protein